MPNDQRKHQQIAKTIVQSASAKEQEALRIWAQGLLDIRATNLPTLIKARQAIKHTIDSKVILPIIKRSAVELKRVGWDERSWKARLGMGAVIGTIAAFGNAGAGIAALGGAIGVPLWIVIGAGATFAGAIVDEVAGNPRKPKTTYTEIEAEKKIEDRR